MSEYISFENLAASAKTEYEKLQTTLAVHQVF